MSEQAAGEIVSESARMGSTGAEVDGGAEEPVHGWEAFDPSLPLSAVFNATEDHRVVR